MTCTNCNKKVNGGTYLNGVFYCPMCTSIIHRNYAMQPRMHTYEDVNDPCSGCSNSPANGGSGVCHCTVPYISRNTRRTNPPIHVPIRIITSTGVTPEWSTDSSVY